jgi:chromosome segregation ATPase
MLGPTELQQLIQRLRLLVAPRDQSPLPSRANSIPKRTAAQKKALTRAFDNLIFVAIAWRFDQGGIDEAQLIALGRQSLFPGEVTSEQERAIALLRLFASLNEKKGLGALLRYLHDESSEERNALLQARRDFEQCAEEVTGLEREKDALTDTKEDLEQQLEQRAQEILALQAEIQRMKESANVSKVHYVDDLLTLRSGMLNTLVKERERLSESITALSREPPKVDVARAYLGAVQDALIKEINRLKEK